MESPPPAAAEVTDTVGSEQPRKCEPGIKQETTPRTASPPATGSQGDEDRENAEGYNTGEDVREEMTVEGVQGKSPAEAGKNGAAATPSPTGNDEGPNHEEMNLAIRDLLSRSDMETLTRRILRENLEDRFGLARYALDGRRKEINEILNQALTEMEPAEEEEQEQEEEQADDGDDDYEPPASSHKRKATTQGGAKKKSRKASAADDEEYSAEEDEDESGSSDDQEYERATAPRRAGRRVGLKQSQANLMTKAHFVEHALPMESNVGDLKFVMKPREFNTGSCGWFYGAKHEMDVGGQKVMCQLTFNCAVLGSKLWSKGRARKG